MKVLCVGKGTWIPCSTMDEAQAFGGALQKLGRIVYIETYAEDCFMLKAY